MNPRIVIAVIAGGTVLAAAVLIGYRVGIARADPPADADSLAYSGILEDGNGKLIDDDQGIPIRVRLFATAVPGDAPLCETDAAAAPVPVRQGRFTVALPVACVAAVRNSAAPWVELTVANGSPMARTRLLAVPYAVQAASAGSATGALKTAIETLQAKDAELEKKTGAASYVKTLMRAKYGGGGHKTFVRGPLGHTCTAVCGTVTMPGGSALPCAAAWCEGTWTTRTTPPLYDPYLGYVCNSTCPASVRPVCMCELEGQGYHDYQLLKPPNVEFY